MQSDRSTLKRMLQWTTYRTQLFLSLPYYRWTKFTTISQEY